MSNPGSQGESTLFAPAGRLGHQQLVAQMRRALADPSVRAVLESVSGFVMVLNRQRQVVAANQELLDALGRHEEGCVIGLRPGEVFNCVHFTEGPDGCGTARHCRACGAVLAILSSQQTGAPVTGECRLSAMKDGRVMALEMKLRATPLQIADEQFTIFVLHDVSDLKRREVLERTFLDDFLKMVAGIVGLGERAEKLESSQVASQVLAVAGTLRDEILSQRTLLDAENNKLPVEKVEFDLVELLSSLQVLFACHPVSAGKNLDIAAPPSGVRLHTDRALLSRVLVSGLKNAFEATPAGGTVRFSYGAEAVRPVFVIQNAGVIPEAIQPHIFERSFSTHGEPGRGLGTYAMRLFGENYLGGSVSFTSDAENGTRFFVSLPWNALAGHVVPREESVANVACRGRLLFVDDDEPVRRLGTLLLARLGYFVTPCRSGAEALAVFTASPDSFDGVVTDFKMPEMNGLELTRSLLQLRPQLPILLCSGMISAPDDVRTAGVRGCLYKPFTFQELAQTVSTVFDPPRGG